MSGIIGTAASRVMVSGDTAVTQSVSGYVVGEQITLSTTPTGTDYSWGQSIPTSSAPSKSALSGSTGASVTFTPDVGGIYVVTCTVDSVTVYTLTLSVTDTVASTPYEAVRFQQAGDVGVPTPTAGAVAVYVSDDIDSLAQKLSSGVIVPIWMGTVGAALTDADATIQIGDGVHRSMPRETLSANRSVTLGTTGASVGHVVWIHRLDAKAFTLAVINGGVGAGTLFTFPVSERHSVRFRYDGTNWSLADRLKLV